MNKRFTFLSAALTVILLGSFAVAQEDAASKVEKRRRFIYVPYEDLDRVLGRGRYGAVIEFEEYLRLLKVAKEKEELKPPAEWVIQSSQYTGVVGEKQVKFTAEVAFSILTEGYALVALPFGAVGITSATLDGKPANLHMLLSSRLSPSLYTLIAIGEGAHTLSITFAAPLMHEKRGKSLGLRIPPSPCSTVTLKIPGKAEVSASPDIFSKTYSESDDATTVEIFAGGKDSILAYITQEEKKVEVEPFITSESESLIHLDPRTVRVQSLITVKVYRKEVSSLTISLPQDYKIVELSNKELLDWTEEKGAVRQAVLRFREPVKASTTITLSLEKELPQSHEVEVPAISVAQARVVKPLVQIMPSQEVTFEVTERKNLNEVTPRPPVVGKTATLPTKAFEGWLEPYTLVLKVSPVAPVINSFLTTLVSVERASLLLWSSCTFEVKEGTIYTLALAVPKEWEILSVAAGLPQDQYDYTVTPAEQQNIIEITLKRKYQPGAIIEVAFFARFLPKDAFWEELPIQIPRVVPRGANLRLATLVFSAEDSMTLSGIDIVGLADLDVTQIERRGIAVPNTVLGYEVKKDDYSGVVIARMKKPRISATSITYLAINESLFQASSLLSLNFGERPAREFQFVLPAGTGAIVDIRGDFIKEKTPLLPRPDGDYWKISLQREVLGEYHLYIAFDVKVGKDAKELTAPKILVPDAERQNGFVAVEAGEGIEILAAPNNLTELPVTSVPYPQALAKFYVPKRLLIHAFRYTTTDYSLKLTVQKHPLGQILTEIIPKAVYTTVFSTEGVEQTRALFELTSVGNQFFSFRLPEGAQLWSVLLGRDAANLLPVKPAKKGAEILVPLTAVRRTADASQTGRENTYFISVIYQRKSEPMKTSGTLQFSLPVTEPKIPVLQSQWQTYLPGQFRYTSFGGDMKLATEPQYQPLILEYLWLYLLGIFVILLILGTVRHLRFVLPSRVAFYVVIAALVVVILAALVVPTLMRPREQAMVVYELPEAPEVVPIKTKRGLGTMGTATEETKKIMAEKPITILKEEEEKDKLPTGPDIKVVDAYGVSPATKAPAQPVPQNFTIAGGGTSITWNWKMAQLKEKEKRLLSLPINLRWEGTPLSFFSLSRGGIITVNYVSQNYTLVICLLLTLVTFLIAVSFRKGTLRIKLAYLFSGLILFSLLPGIAGPENTIYCNAVLFGIISGALFYGIASLARIYRRAIPVLVLLLSLCSVIFAPNSLYAQEEQKEQVQKESEKVRQPEIDGVIVPYDTKNLKEIVGKGRVYIPVKRYEDLLRSAGLLKEEPLTPPLPFSVNSANYTAVILSDRAEFSLEMSLELLRAETTEVFIGLPGIALQNAKLDGKDARLRSDASGYFLVLTEPGCHTFTASFSLPIDAKRVSGLVEFPVRPVACAQLTAKTDRPDTEILIKSALGGQEVKETEAGKEVIAALGAASTISISYGPKEMVATGARVATDARLSHYFWLSESLIIYRCNADITVSGGERDSLFFTLPDNLEIYQVVAATEIRTWRITRDPAGKTILEILLYEPVKEALTLTISGAQVLAQKTGDFSLPFPQVVDARKETGDVLVFLKETLKANVTGTENLIQTTLAAKTEGNYELHSAYRYSSRPIKFSLQTLEKETDLRANIFTQLSITKEKLSFNTTAALTVQGAPVYNFSLSVPAQFEIEEVSCPNMASKFIKKEGERKIITIHLSAPLLGSTSISVSGSRITDEKETELSLPQVTVANAKFVEGWIVVSSTEGIALTTKKTENLIPVDVRTVPYPRQTQEGAPEARLAFTFKNPEHSGTIGVDRLKPTLSAITLSSALVKNEVVSFTTVIEYRIKTAPRRRFSFSMPYGLAQKAILSIPFERQKTLTKEGEGDTARGIWTVELQRELTESYSIAINWEKIPKGAELLEIPYICATGVESASTYILLQNSSGLKVTEGEKKNLEPATREEIPLLGAVLAERASLVCTYRVQDTGKEHSLLFSVTRLEEVKEIEAIIEIAEITTVISDDGYSFNEASYRIQNRAKQYLAIEIPEGAELWSAEVAGRQVKPALPPEGMGKKILLPLLKQGKGEFSYNVKIYYGLSLKSKPGFGTSFSPKAPKPLDISIGQTFWTVYAPEKFDYRFDGNLDEVIESVKEVEKALSYAQQAQRLVREMQEGFEAGRQYPIDIAYNYARVQMANIEQLSNLAQEQLARAQTSNEALATQAQDKFKQQYESNRMKLEMAQKQMAQVNLRVQQQEVLRTQSELARKIEQGEATVGKLIAPEAEQSAKAEQYLQKSAQRVRADIEKEEKDRKEIDELQNVRKEQLPRGTSFENLSDKNLASKSAIYRMRFGNGALAKEPAQEKREKFVVSGYTGGVEHGARAAGVMPPQINLPKVGKTLNFKKLGTDPVLTLYSKDREAFVRIYTFLTLLALILLLAAAFVLKLSFFADKNLKRQIVEGTLLFLAGYFCVLSVFVAVPIGCLSLLALILAKSRRIAIIFR
jgi:hypothetical protein